MCNINIMYKYSVIIFLIFSSIQLNLVECRRSVLPVKKGRNNYIEFENKKSYKYDKSSKTFPKIAFNIPKNINQRYYVDYLNDENNHIVLGIGSAGTGKTMFACYQAINNFNSGVANKIILTRPMVSVDEEDIGFLPGDINAKMAPWVRPFMDIFSEYYSQKELNRMILEKTIEISPLAFMRGRTFKDAFIIADEMQNSSPSQMLMLITRIGDSSRMVITGDLQQSDRTSLGLSNGLNDFFSRLENKDTSGIKYVQFKEGDIERSEIVKTVLKLYSN